MTKAQKLYVLGSGWISTTGYGFYGSKPQFTNERTEFKCPPLEEYIDELPSRFGRFDQYTKLCFSAAVLALKDAGRLQRDGKKNVGIIVGSYSGVYDNDLNYYQTTQEAQGEFSSPNLFSYTLPNVALGEIAVYFGFVGPTFCVGNDPANPGLELIPAVLSLLAAEQVDCILAGWAEVAQNLQDGTPLPKGAAFSLLTLDQTDQVKAECLVGSDFQFTDLFEVK
jgi:3-oxoacyl-(acyl-carrier-protein) synthase